MMAEIAEEKYRGKKTKCELYIWGPEFAVPALNSIIDAGHDVELVVTQPDRRGNRGKCISPVKA